MFWDVKSVKPMPGHCLHVEIEDGRSGIFDMKPYLEHGMFKELKNTNYFNQVGVFLGAITWPNGQDISPEALIAQLEGSPSRK